MKSEAANIFLLKKYKFEIYFKKNIKLFCYIKNMYIKY